MTFWLKKYMRIEYLEWTLRRAELYLGDPMQWTDKNDTAALSAFARCTGATGIHATCLSMAPDRYHFWDIFCGKESGVCLWFNYESLLQDIKLDTTLESGKVKYYTVAELAVQCKACGLALAKRKQYQDEREFRVFRRHLPPSSLPASSGLKFRPESLRRIYINDWVDNGTHRRLKDSIVAWTEGRYAHLQVLRNRILKYPRWIRALNSLADDEGSRRCRLCTCVAGQPPARDE